MSFSLPSNPFAPDYLGLIQEYAAGIPALKEACAGLRSSEFHRQVSPGAWSIHEVVCHLADFEILSVVRIMRFLAEETPHVIDGDENRFAASLNYDRRDFESQLAIIEASRRQVLMLLQGREAGTFEKVATHSLGGTVTLAEFLKKLACHLPHHVGFIRGKRETLARRECLA